MKTFARVCLLLLAITWAETAFCQASFFFRNYAGVSFDKPVFDAEGNRLAGTNYLAMLYGGPTVDSLQPAWDYYDSHEIEPVPFTYMPTGQAGYFRYVGSLGDAVRIPTVPCAGEAWLQVRAWDARLGTNYEQVQNLGLGGYGESNLFQKRGGSTCGLPSPPEYLIGLQSFSLREVIPEPSSTLLLLLGVPGLLLFHRRGSR